MKVNDKKTKLTPEAKINEIKSKDTWLSSPTV